MEITKKQQQPPPPPESREAQKCPRCDSSNTKFCYYNNYSLSQPRYYCRTCRRYWTHGGALRNVPVGGGSRNGSKRARTAEAAPPLVPAAEASAGYLPPFAFGQPQTQSFAQASSSSSSSSSLGVSISTLLQGFGDMSGPAYGGSVHPHGQFFVNNPNPSRVSGSNSSSLSHQAWPSMFNADTNIGAPSNANNNNNNNTGGGFGSSFTARPSQWPHDSDLPGPFGSSPP